jgi:hypothetical protein
MRERSLVSRPLALLAFSYTLGLALFEKPASAAVAEPSGAPISSTARCSVSLGKVSYDDPGADDAELVELYVERRAGTGSTHAASVMTGGQGCGSAKDASPGSDAGTSMDASDVALTLGDCGLGALVLVDGAVGKCVDYRTIPLSQVVVPRDGHVLICAADSVLAAHGVCDVMQAGRSELKNGWLQNGPNDGLRFVGADDEPLLDVTYEGAPPCWSAPATPLVPETGQASDFPVPTDDVNVFCDGRFVLLQQGYALPRHPPICPHTPPSDGGPPIEHGGSSGGYDAGDVGWMPERVPDDGYGTGTAGFELDAGQIVLATPPRRAPSSPGCTLAVAASGLSGAPWLAASAAALAVIRRRRRTRTRTRIRSRRGSALRADCGARCGSWPRRSPSR